MEALGKVQNDLPCVVDSDVPQHWAEAIKKLRHKIRETHLRECEELQRRYDEKYSWRKQCAELVETMFAIAHGRYVVEFSTLFKQD